MQKVVIPEDHAPSGLAATPFHGERDLTGLAAPRPLEALVELDQEVLDALPIGFYCCDAEGRIVRVSRKAIELWGQEPRLHDFAQRFCGCFRVETLDGALVPPDQTPMARSVLYGEAFEGVEAVVQNPDGKRWIARANITPLRDPAGRSMGAINCFQDVTTEYEMRQTLERQRLVFDLAMIASKMGTWRYTLNDNICIYDENAQRLYGLTEARFLHDEEGVKAKFHPNDLDQMWAGVEHALDPEADGHYEVEYRVKQLDGAWRWLSAWGTVEFEGDGPGRQAVAISGASRDLTEKKDADALQRLLINELDHRVKNTLAMVQSITTYTLRDATNLQAAREALTERIVSLARVHDLLTARSWSGADLSEVVHQAMQPFAAAQLTFVGPSVEVSAKHALALSLALHELATNAAKYGALSVPEGRIEIRWERENERFSLIWCEAGGPLVQPPTRRGFGSRLLDSLVRDLGGPSQLDYASTGFRCKLTATL